MERRVSSGAHYIITTFYHKNAVPSGFDRDFSNSFTFILAGKVLHIYLNDASSKTCSSDSNSNLNCKILSIMHNVGCFR